MSAILVHRVAPGSTVQDEGRPGMLRYGLSASGPMDRASFIAAGHALGRAGRAGIEVSMGGIVFGVEGDMAMGMAGGGFELKVDGAARDWGGRVRLNDGDSVEVLPARAGVYGYLRFDREIGVPEVLGSRATNLVAGLGGFEGRALRKGDRIAFDKQAEPMAVAPPPAPWPEGPLPVLPGLHADQLGGALWAKFTEAPFRISSRLDRMGIRLDDPTGVFRGVMARTLVSDAVVPGDVQILGDGTPVILMRDHQPTGGYPRIATVLDGALDALAQMRPGAELRFTPVTLAHARRIMR